MVVDCYALAVNIKGGSSICIVECAGIQLTSGDVLLVKAPLAGALYVQYRPHLSEPMPVQLQDQERLRHGHYEVRRLKMIFKDDDQDFKPASTEPVVNVCGGPDHPLNMVEDEEVEEKAVVEEISDNRSMANPRAKKRQKAKRNA